MGGGNSFGLDCSHQKVHAVEGGGEALSRNMIDDQVPQLPPGSTLDEFNRYIENGGVGHNK